MSDIDRKLEHNSIPKGVWPTLVTPLTESGEIDYDALSHLVDWFVDRGVHGLFAVCQSSEMFLLSLKERVRLASATVEAAAGRVSVIASGHVSESHEAQLEELSAIAETGVDAAVLVNNRMATPNESDDVWRENTWRLIDGLPSDMLLGIYECPYPYKRVVTTENLKWCIETGRFGFFKDTCCDLELIAKRADVSSGTSFHMYNANAASLLYSLRAGYAGYSGVMANFHPEIYVRLYEVWEAEAERAEAIEDFLGCAAKFEGATYPANAKYYLGLEGVPMSLRSRRNPGLELSSLETMELGQLRDMTGRYRAALGELDRHRGVSVS